MMWLNIDTELLGRLPRKPMNGTVGSSTEWAAVATKLAEYRVECTADDWDGQGADAISPDVLESACSLATALEAHGVAAPTWAVPTFTSSLSFEWDLSDGASCEIEIVTPTSLQVTRLTPGKPRERWTVTDGVAVA